MSTRRSIAASIHPPGYPFRYAITPLMECIKCGANLRITADRYNNYNRCLPCRDAFRREQKDMKRMYQPNVSFDQAYGDINI